MAADLKRLALRYAQLETERQPWVATWRTLAEHYLPTGYRDANDSNAHREKPLLNPNIVDSTGIYALRTLAAGMQGGMTSPARPWFSLMMNGDEQVDDMASRAWIDEVVERMRTILHTSNFYGVIYQAYAQLATFGTACVFETADMNGFRFECCQAGTYLLDVDSKGRVDTVMRKVWMTARQLGQEFGENKLPAQVTSLLKNNANTGDNRFAVYHAVYPRNEQGMKTRTANGMQRPYASVYWMDAGNGPSGLHLLRESGFESFPFFGVRWTVESGDVYGTSPAMDTLPDCKMLQQVSKTTIMGIHKMVNPPMISNSGALASGLDLRPGAVNYVTAVGNGVPVAPAMSVQPDVNAAQMLIQQVQNQIKEGLYNDLFRMLLGSDRRQVTATEVDAKEAEKMILIGPVLERLHDELFIPLIDRTFSLMERFNALPEAPQSLAGQDLRVEFISTLAQAQKLVSTGSVQQLVAFVGNMAQLDPSVLDALNTDKTVDNYSEYLGVDAGMLRTQDERDSIRQQRAQAQQQAQEQAAAQQAIQNMPQAAKSLSETQMGGEQPSALDALLSGIGGY